MEVSFVLYERHYYKKKKVLKNEPSEISERQPLKNLKGYGLVKQTISLQFFYRLPSTNFTWSIHEYFVPYQRGNGWVDFEKFQQEF